MMQREIWSGCRALKEWLNRILFLKYYPEKENDPRIIHTKKMQDLYPNEKGKNN